MHPLQQHILKQLTLSKTRRFSDLKPKGIESNRFIYHLNKLVSNGYLRKQENGYQLAPAGTRYIDKLSLQSFHPRMQPKVVTVIICRNVRGEYLLYRRARQPFFGLVGFPYGKVHFGETIARAAARELKEKTGISGVLTHKGDAYLTVSTSGELATHMLCHVFTGIRPKGSLLRDSQVGSCFWADIKSIPVREYLPGFLELYRYSRREGHFFTELNVRS